MRLNIVLIDSENVQPDSIDKLAHEHFRVIIFLGANQKRIDVDIVKAVQSLGGGGEYIQINGNGPNALDFHIAFYIGILSKDYPDSYFHIISKDKGFEPLIKHLKENDIFCSRWVVVTEIPLVKVSLNVSSEQRAQEFIEKKLLVGKGRPATIKTLKSAIHSQYLKVLPDEEVDKIIVALENSGTIVLKGNKVQYP